MKFVTLITLIWLNSATLADTASASNGSRSVDRLEIIPGKKTLSAQQINGALAKHTKEFAACVEEVTKVNPAPGSGTLHINFYVGADGKVTWAKKVDSDLGNDYLVECVLKVIRKTRFPKIRSKEGTEVKSYPFFFHNDPPSEKKD